MKILPEFFDPTQFVVANYDTHFTVKRPYTTFAKSIGVKFEDYYVRDNNNLDKFEIAMRNFR
jgi:hypothetical protein